LRTILVTVSAQLDIGFGETDQGYTQKENTVYGSVDLIMLARNVN